MSISINNDMFLKIRDDNTDLIDSPTITFSVSVDPIGIFQFVGGAFDSNAYPDIIPTSMENNGIIQEIFELWDDLIAKEISYSHGNEDADITVNTATNLVNSGGLTYSTVHIPLVPDDVDVYLVNAPLDLGSIAWGAAVHEFGHALGLQHPGSYNGGTPTYAARTYDEDTRQFSVMSYFQPSNYNSQVNWTARPQTPMIYDIMAIQEYYGVSTTTRIGNTTYGFNSNAGNRVFDFSINTNPILTIFDSGGAGDTLDVSGFSNDQTISLEEGSYSNIGTLPGVNTTAVQNVAIAFGTIIEYAVGGSGNDRITGNQAGNFLIGGAGNDSIFGGTGADRLLGGLGNDSLNGGFDNDLLEGGDGDDFLLGGFSGSDTLVGENGNDSLQGQDGNDSLEGGAGADDLWGGDGNDTLKGGADGDTLTGSDGSDQLEGGGGNDYLDGGNDADFIDAGDGDDIINDYGASDGADNIFGGLGNDTLRFTSNGLNPSNTVDLRSAFLNYGGNGFFNSIETIIGGSGNDFFYMEDSFGVANRLEGGLGNDSLGGGDGNDTLLGESGADDLRGWLGNDSLIGGDNNDYLAGEQDNDWLQGDTGSDTLYGGDGNDTLDGGNFAILVSDDGNFLSGDAGNDRVVGSAGNDTMSGGIGNDVLGGNDGSDTINGDDGDDTINGGDGADSLIGGAGNDIFFGGAGNDTIVGGSGSADRISFDTVAGHEWAVNVALGTAELISLTTFNVIETDTFSSIEQFAGSEGRDGFIGNDAAQVFDGNGGNDYFVAGLGNDTIYGRLGDRDEMFMAHSSTGTLTFSGDDTINMTTGIATRSYTYDYGGFIGLAFVNNTTTFSGIEYISADDGNDTVIGSSVNETILGDLGNDSLDGGGGNDSLDGGAGSDTLTGGNGIDLLAGGDGNDYYYVDIADTIVELSGAASGYDIVIANQNFILSDNVEQLVVQGAATAGYGSNTANYLYGGNSGLSLNLDGGGGDDVIYAGLAGGNTLTGGSGVDTLLIYGGDIAANTANGGLGADIYYTYSVNDVLSEAGGDGIDTVYSSHNITLGAGFEQLLLFGTATTATGSADNNIIYGNSTTGAVNLFGLGGADVLFGGSFNDTLSGGTGVDLLFGLGGTNTLIGGDDTDVYYIETAANTVTETLTGGFDTMYSNFAGVTTLAANVEQLILYGNATGGTGTGGNDYLYANSAALAVTLDGGGGSDYLLGSAQNDTLIGGAGNDQIDLASGGIDRVRYNTGGNMGADTVYNFNAVENDLIDLTGQGYVAGNIGGAITVATFGGGTQVTFASGALAGTTINLVGVAAANVTAADFVF